MAKSVIGLIFSVIGMAGLVLSIISLLPVNVYNVYIAGKTVIDLLLFEHERTNKDWQDIPFSNEAILFFIFLVGSIFSSLLEIITTLFACCQHSASQPLRKTTYEPQPQRKSWFIRTACFTVIVQVLFSLLGMHLIYYLEIDYKVIPMEIQYNSFVSCVILAINYACLLLFSFILLLASFCILISAYRHQPRDETTPLIAV